MATTKTKTKTEKKRTIAQQAGTAKARLKRAGITSLMDHRGKDVPIEYVPSIDLLKHFKTLELIEEARELKRLLAELKFKCQETGDELYEQLMEENEIRPDSKGGFTLATFDKSARVVFKMDSVKDKNEEELTMAETFFSKFLQEDFPDKDPKQHFLYSMFNDLVRNNKDEIDLRMVGKFNRYGSRIKNKNYKKFLEHLNQAFDVRHTKRFEIFDEKNDQNSYDSLVLSYAKLDPLAPVE